METFIMNVYRAIDKNSVQFDFLVSKPGCDYEEEAISLGANIYYSGSRRSNGFIGYCKNLDLFFKIHAKDYVAVHYHESTLSSLEPLFFAKKYGIKKRFLHSHSSSVAGNKFHYVTHYFNKLFVRFLATNYFGCSQKALNWFYNGTGVRSKAVMVANGIPVDDYCYNFVKRQEVRANLGLQETELVIGHIGRFVWIKNHKYLICIFDQIKRKRPNSKLLLIGVGPLIDEIKEMVKDKGLVNSVLFLGLRSDVAELLQAIDVVVMPSIYEGMPVSLIEAQASGTIVYGSDTISRDTSLTDRMHFLSIQSNPTVWADDILSNKNLNKTNTSSDIIRAGFDIKTIAHNFTNLYK